VLDDVLIGGRLAGSRLRLRNRRRRFADPVRDAGHRGLRRALCRSAL